MTPPTLPPGTRWHAIDLNALLTLLNTGGSGLTSEEARLRRNRYGLNRLPRRKPASIRQILLRQFKSPLIFILAIAAAVSLLIHPDNPTDALFILAVLLLNAAIGGFQEYKAERSSQALLRLLQIRASVLRDGEVQEMDAEQVVPGDVVWLESGNRVPADLRLLTAHGLEIDESLLTGESLPVHKDQQWSGDDATPMADQRNMAYAGAIVLHGRARGVVVATGPATAVGQLAVDVLGAEGGRPPLLVRMERFTRVIGLAVLAAALVIGVLGVLVRGYALTDMFLFGVALAVSAIPEGLPVALTVALAIATSRMARRGVIVRRLAAVEGLGSCTLIGSDKTGTLTCNELTVRRIVLPSGASLPVSGEGFIPSGEVALDAPDLPAATGSQLDSLALAAVLCNEGSLRQGSDGWTWRGDPTDLALLALGRKLGLAREEATDRYPLVNEIPFEAEHRYAAAFHRIDERVAVFVKGAPERVLPMCAFADRTEGLEQVELAELATGLARQGYRVLALARGWSELSLDPEQTPPEPGELEFLGFVGMIDPLRPEVRGAVAACRMAGIEVCMITGDHPDTALAIGRELGLADRPDQVLTGRDLEQLSPDRLEKAVDTVRIFARVSPRQKLELVEAAQKTGRYVAVTGDGVNDAPALRQANIGVAMGRSGTDVAREAAELVLTDDHFATIVAGIEEGRVAYDNVRKVIYLLVSTGAAEVLLLGLVVVGGWPQLGPGQALLPLLPVQLLWLNLVTNGIQDVALAFEPTEDGVLRRPPRPPREPVFNRLMVERTMIAAVVMAAVCYAAFGWMIQVNGWSPDQARNGLLLLMVLFEIVHIGNCRSERTSAFRLSPLRSPVLLVGTLLALGVHLAAMHIPLLQRVLGIAPVSWQAGLVLLALSLTILAAMELHKWWWNVRQRNREQAAR